MVQLLAMLKAGTTLKVTVYIVLGSGDLSPGYVHDDVSKITLKFGAILWWYIFLLVLQGLLCYWLGALYVVSRCGSSPALSPSGTCFSKHVHEEELRNKNVKTTRGQMLLHSWKWAGWNSSYSNNTMWRVKDKQPSTVGRIGFLRIF